MQMFTIYCLLTMSEDWTKQNWTKIIFFGDFVQFDNQNLFQYLVWQNLMNGWAIVITASMGSLDLVHFVSEVSLKVFLECQWDVADELFHGEDLIVPNLSLVIHVQDLKRADLSTKNEQKTQTSCSFRIFFPLIYVTNVDYKIKQGPYKRSTSSGYLSLGVFFQRCQLYSMQ